MKIWSIRKLTYLLLLACAAFSPWGDLMRFAATTTEEGSRGITTILALGIVGLGLFSGKAFEAIKVYKTALFFPTFLLMSGTASFFAPEPRKAIMMAVLLGAYFLLAFSVAGLRLQRKEIIQLLTVFAFSSALMSVASLIDYFDLIDLPRVNERSASRGLGVANLLGPFYSQTPMAAHLCLAFPIPLAFLFSYSDKSIQKFLWILVLAPIILASILTYSRGLIVSFIVVIGYIFYAGSCKKRLMFWAKNLIIIAAISVFGVFLLKSYVPDQYQALSIRLNDITPEGIQNSRSDITRFGTIESTLKDLSKSPFGVGFTKAEYQVGTRIYEKNSHSNVVDILRAGGFLGLVLVILFILPILKEAFLVKNPQVELPLFSALISFFVYGLTHTTLATLFAWIVAGVAFSWISIEARCRRKWFKL